MSEVAPSDFEKIMDFITSIFPEVEGTREMTSRPLLPGENKRQETDQAPKLTHALPVLFTLDAALAALAKATESTDLLFIILYGCKMWTLTIDLER